MAWCIISKQSSKLGLFMQDVVAAVAGAPELLELMYSPFKAGLLPLREFSAHVALQPMDDPLETASGQ